jgi:hypothetical protein
MCVCVVGMVIIQRGVRLRCVESWQSADCSDSYGRMRSVLTVIAQCGLFWQLWQSAVCSDSYGRMQSVQTVMAECGLFWQLWQNAVCSDSYGRMRSVQTVMAECGLFRQLHSFWWNFISRSKNTTKSTKESSWEAESHTVGQETSCPF